MIEKIKLDNQIALVMVSPPPPPNDPPKRETPSFGENDNPSSETTSQA